MAVSRKLLTAECETLNVERRTVNIECGTSNKGATRIKFHTE